MSSQYPNIATSPKQSKLSRRRGEFVQLRFAVDLPPTSINRCGFEHFERPLVNSLCISSRTRQPRLISLSMPSLRRARRAASDASSLRHARPPCDYRVITFSIPFYAGNRLSSCEPCWIRTSDLLIKSQLLYRLS